MWLEPAEIRFTHDSISPVFSCGRRIYDTYDELSRGFKSVHDIPRMIVTYIGGEWYTYTGNRRLWVFQKLQNEGVIHEICVDTTDMAVPRSKFTTQNGGTSVKVRRGIDSAPKFTPPRRQPPPGKAELRNVSCPVCGVVRFKNGMGAVMHVESGSCPGCPGADTARRQIFNFVSGHRRTQSLLTPMLMDMPGGLDVVDKPYQCKHCAKTFRQLSQLMQHQRDKHALEAPRLSLGYY